MKSMFVTLLSGLLLYAGYYFHPIVHRIGNQITGKLQAEFVPVNQSFETAAEQKIKITPPDNEVQETNIADETQDQDENQQQDSSETSDTEVEPDNSNKISDASGITKIKEDSYSRTTKKAVSPPRKPPVRKTPVFSNPGSNRTSKKKKTTYPPKYDLYSAIKKGIDVRIKTNEYFISERDKKIGRELVKIEEEFDRKYNGTHLTSEDIDRLQEEHDRAIQELANKHGLTKNQLLVFGAVIKQHL